MKNITIARNLNHMTIVQLAEAVGVSRQYISQLENGVRNLGPNNVNIFADLLNVDKAWLLGCPGILPVYDPLEKVTCMGEIIHTDEIPGYGIMYLVHVQDTGDILAMIIARGMQYTVADHSPNQPLTVADIPDYKWMNALGQDAATVEGLPYFMA